ncbi:MAG: hypothetical protein H0T53_02865 [Herpetosiphonaceae bacterium]|nr:hypothetical protein [Herpetosiphonaceae bacterium]
MRQILGGAVGLIVLIGCGQAAVSPTPAPTFGPVLSQPQAEVSAATNVPIMARPTEVSAQPATPTPAAEAAGDQSEQYRRWMSEARTLHPYSESIDTMWQVMLCESSGNPTIQGPGELIGLFQYQPSTWNGPWNPYRDQPIIDARAQIFATAKAWSDGNQQWWGVCLP